MYGKNVSTTILDRKTSCVPPYINFSMWIFVPQNVTSQRCWLTDKIHRFYFFFNQPGFWFTLIYPLFVQELNAEFIIFFQQMVIQYFFIGLFSCWSGNILGVGSLRRPMEDTDHIGCWCCRPAILTHRSRIDDGSISYVSNKTSCITSVSFPCPSCCRSSKVITSVNLLQEHLHISEHISIQVSTWHCGSRPDLSPVRPRVDPRSWHDRRFTVSFGGFWRQCHMAFPVDDLFFLSAKSHCSLFWIYFFFTKVTWHFILVSPSVQQYHLLDRHSHVIIFLINVTWYFVSAKDFKCFFFSARCICKYFSLRHLILINNDSVYHPCVCFSSPSSQRILTPSCRLLQFPADIGIGNCMV